MVSLKRFQGKNANRGIIMHHDAKKVIVVEIRGHMYSLCQVTNRLDQTGGLH